MLTPTWVEIPVKDVQRALKFYQAVFELGAIEVADDGVRKTATLSGENSPGVSLNQTTNFEPSNKGTLAYFSAGNAVAPYLSRVQAAGGKVVDGKTAMGGGYFYASFEDTEGNLIALSSQEAE